MKKVPWYTSTTTIISTLAFAIIWLGIAGMGNIPNSPQIVNLGQPDNDLGGFEGELDADICGLDSVDCEGYVTMKTTSFSSVECKTTWCQANAGLPRGNKVALNYSKFGRYSKVYVPKYDRTYEVIGSTDSKTDLDFWNADNQQAALAHGTQYLQVELIK